MFPNNPCLLILIWLSKNLPIMLVLYQHNISIMPKIMLAYWPRAYGMYCTWPRFSNFSFIISYRRSKRQCCAPSRPSSILREIQGCPPLSRPLEQPPTTASCLLWSGTVLPPSPPWTLELPGDPKRRRLPCGPKMRIQNFHSLLLRLFFHSCTIWLRMKQVRRTFVFSDGCLFEYSSH